MYRGDIRIVDLGVTMGSEQSGIRPCLIVQNDIGNEHSTTVIIVPITKQTKVFKATHVPIKLQFDSVLLCEQIRTVDKCRVRHSIGKADCNTLKLVSKALKLSIGL